MPFKSLGYKSLRLLNYCIQLFSLRKKLQKRQKPCRFIAFCFRIYAELWQVRLHKQAFTTQKPFATDAADARVKTRSICKDRLAELRV